MSASPLPDPSPRESGGPLYLFDYGMVISTAPTPGDWAALERETGLDLAAPGSSYWRHREEFDAGRLSPGSYWARVVGTPAVDAGKVSTLEELDARQWAHLNPATLRVLETLSGEGARLALLSNMPAGMAERYRRESRWMKFFRTAWFSGELGLLKPAPEIFGHVLAGMHAAPEDVVFIDDNARNIEAAQNLGIRTVHFGPWTNLLQELADLRD
ncbi:HAD family phosphatase [Arthrobacter sp. zg-Y411]|uniref:HAD family hydrolase n=1 Tax=Arthrobacter zhangbolii TaxID=2886936 RepID=UPI001D15DA71|nr:HAD family phosphatase [Arthrobacter zhangbolii]MCC3293432.1 HAD family phosphatase [Arthrobacter zhangbolii]